MLCCVVLCAKYRLEFQDKNGRPGKVLGGATMLEFLIQTKLVEFSNSEDGAPPSLMSLQLLVGLFLNLQLIVHGLFFVRTSDVGGGSRHVAHKL